MKPETRVYPHGRIMCGIAEEDELWEKWHKRWLRLQLQWWLYWVWHLWRRWIRLRRRILSRERRMCRHTATERAFTGTTRWYLARPDRRNGWSGSRSSSTIRPGMMARLNTGFIVRRMVGQTGWRTTSLRAPKGKPSGWRESRFVWLERLRSIIRFVTGCISRRMDGVRAGSMMARSRVLRAKRRDSKVWKCSWFRSLRRWDWCTAYIARRMAGRHRTKRWDRLAAQRAKENDWKALRSLWPEMNIAEASNILPTYRAMAGWMRCQMVWWAALPGRQNDWKQSESVSKEKSQTITISVIVCMHRPTDGFRGRGMEIRQARAVLASGWRQFRSYLWKKTTVF